MKYCEEQNKNYKIQSFLFCLNKFFCICLFVLFEDEEFEEGEKSVNPSKIAFNDAHNLWRISI